MRQALDGRHHATCNRHHATYTVQQSTDTMRRTPDNAQQPARKHKHTRTHAHFNVRDTGGRAGGRTDGRSCTYLRLVGLPGGVQPRIFALGALFVDLLPAQQAKPSRACCAASAATYCAVSHICHICRHSCAGVIGGCQPAPPDGRYRQCALIIHRHDASCGTRIALIMILKCVQRFLELLLASRELGGLAIAGLHLRRFDELLLDGVRVLDLD